MESRSKLKNKYLNDPLLKDDGIECDSLESSGDLDGQIDDMINREYGLRRRNHSDSSMTDSLELLPTTPSSDIANFADELLSEENSFNDCGYNRKNSRSGIPKLVSRANTVGSSSVKGDSEQFGANSNGANMRYNLQSSRDKNFMTSTESFMSSATPRETIASRLRYEKCHTEHNHIGPEEGDYVTPTQRKDIMVKDMRKRIGELESIVEEKDDTISKLIRSETKQAADILDAKNSELSLMRKEMEDLQKSNDILQASKDEYDRNMGALKASIQSMKTQLDDQEAKSQEMYLEMYRKGQNSAQFEREEELERLAKTGGLDKNKVTVTELMKKLSETESQLANWQEFRRQESYDDARKPETESEATLRFLRDSFYHYLTDSKDADRHLRAMIRIFNFTEVQKKKIATALLHDKKHKSK